MKKALKCLGLIVISPILLLLLIMVLLYLPPVQNYTVKKLCAYASEQTGMQISIDHFYLGFPLDLLIEGVEVKDSTEFFAEMERAKVSVALLPLLKLNLEVGELDLLNVKANTADKIESVQLKGKFDHLNITSVGNVFDSDYISVASVDLNKEHADLGLVGLKGADLDIIVPDSVPEDTTQSEPTKWVFNIAGVNISDSKFRLHTKDLDAKANMASAVVETATVDLGKGCYTAERFAIKSKQPGTTRKEILNQVQDDVAGGQNDVAGSKDDGLGFSSLAYKSADGMDINAESLNLEIDSISYSDPMNLTCNIKQFSTNVALDIPSSGIKSNLKLDNLSANVRMDSTHVDVPYFSLLTPNTNLKGNVEYGFGNDDSGLQADVKGVIGRKDVEQFVNLKELGVSIPQSVGTDVSVTLKNDDLEIRKAEIKLDNSTITAKGNMNLNTMAYNLNADVKNLNVKRYMPELGVGIFDGKIAAKGRGFDIAHDKIDAKLQVRRLQYGGYDLRNITLDGDLSKGLANMTLNIRDAYLDADITLNGNIAQIMKMDMSHPDFRNINGDVTAKVRRADLYHLKVIDHPLTITNVNADASVRNGYLDASIKSRNDMLWGDIDISGMLKTKDFSATIVSDISRLDLKKMGFADDRFITGFCGNIDFYTDMGDNIKVQGLLSDIAIDDSTNYLLPVDAEIDIFSSKDTTYAKIEAASFLLDFKAKSGFSKLADSFTRLIDEIKLQSKNTEIDEPKLKSMYPDCSLYMRMESESPLMLLIDRMGYSFNDIQIDLTSEKDVGLNGYAAAQSLSVDTTMTLDDVLFTITSNNSSTKFSADVQNYPGSKDMVFRAMAEGEIVKNGANIDLKLYDANERLGIRLGAEAMLDKDSLLMRLTPENPILGYKEYHLNPDNFLCLHEKNKITTDIQLVADDGTGLKIYSIPNDEALQDLSLTINRFDLTELTQILPYLPNITGYLEGDMHYVQHPSTTPGQAGKMTVASDIGIRNMTFEQYGLGDISSEFVLLPDLTSGGESALDGTLIKDGTEIASISGRYRSGKNHDDDAYLSAQLDLDHMPMDIVNGFIPDKIIGFMGDADGTLSVEGPMDKLMFNGEIYLDSALLFSEPYGVNLRFDNDPVRIVDSKLLLENFSLYAHDDNPLVIHGNVDFSDMDNMSMDLQMRGQNFEAISAKKSMKSLVYGNAFVDIYAKMNGPMNNLNMSGMVNVLATTNLTYVLDDSPLNTDDQLKGLVTFKDFRDTVTVEEEIRPEISGFNMDLRLNVEDGAQILCNLNKAGTNYVELDGGGDLRMKYNTTENLTLTGKYTLNRGEMKYSLPVIPLRTFTIQKGSYVEFLGDPMNPKLNITATETTHAAVSNYGENRRTVKFNAGVKVTKTLQDMGLQFILEAPEDMTVQNELAEMGETAVGKLAVAMLTSGIYMAESNTSNVSINDALNSYLQGQISNIAGNALKTVDVQMGMTNVADETGASYMDYSFSFAKRFWNNRVSVAVGGRYSTSGNTSHNSGAALDNVSLEYRLNTNASKLLRLNYQRNKLDYIEGYVSEYSGGIMLKKKMNALRELFQFGQKKPQPKR